MRTCPKSLCVVGLAAAALLTAGCHTGGALPTDLNPEPIAPPVAVPAYGELVAKYNANIAPLERLWARTKVKIRWRAEGGRLRREKGDGRLMFRRPLDTAWTVEVLGDIKLWAGSDDYGFWLFDRLDGAKAYYGAYGKPLTEPLPLPVQPEAVPYLLGLMPLDPADAPPAPAVEMFRGHCIIEPPGLNLRMQLNPNTGRPTRIDLTDAGGRSVLVCRLTGARPVDLLDAKGEPTGGQTVLPAEARIYPVGEESELTVALTRASTDPKRVKGKWFRFDDLSEWRALKPDGVKYLNEPVKPPAASR